MQHHLSSPRFEWRFLLPKFWPIWLGVVALFSVSSLPYAIQKSLAKPLGWLLSKLAKSRCKVAKTNLKLCFPDMDKASREAIYNKNLQHAGMALLETGMAWWWPDWRVRRIAEVEGLEHVEAIINKGKGVLALAIHNMNLEMGLRVLGLGYPSVAFYRKHDNPLMEFFQYRGRVRSNKYLIPKRNVSGLIDALNQGELCLYAPDQDYGRKRCEFVPFFSVKETATTKGMLLFAESSNCETVFVVSLRTDKGYKVKILPGLTDFPSDDAKTDLTRVNRQVEDLISIAPEQYLWMHKRFKTRPDKKDQSFY